MRRLLFAIALLAAPVVGRAAPPAFAANGNTTVNASGTTCTPLTTTLGTVGADDIILLVATGEGDDAGGTLALTTANGFVAVTGSPVSADNDDGTEQSTEVDAGVWWVRGSSWTAAPVVTDSGDHTTCGLHRFTGAITTGNPWDVIQTSIEATSDTSASITGTSTTVADTLVVLVLGQSNNGNSTTTCSAWSNGNLGSLTEQFDSTNTSGFGGGHCLATGTRSATGDFGATTATLSVAGMKAMFAIALKPPGSTNGTATVTGASGIGLAGSVSSVGGTDGSATLTGSAGVGATGSVTSSGSATRTVTGASGIGAPGALTSLGDGVSSLIGQMAVGFVGNVTASSGGDGDATVTGLAAIGALGAVSSTGDGSGTLAAVGGIGAAGTTTSLGYGSGTLVGASAVGAVGATTSMADAVATLVGQVAIGVAGAVTASGGSGGDGTATISGATAVGTVGVVRRDLQEQIDALGARLEVLERKVRRLIQVIP